MIQPAPASTTPQIKAESTGPPDTYPSYHGNGVTYAPQTHHGEAPASPHDTAYSYQQPVDPSLATPPDAAPASPRTGEFPRSDLDVRS